MQDFGIVQQYYDGGAEDEWKRMDRHPIEFAVTKRLILRHMSEEKARVLDAGGGPGRYAIWLAKLGHEVTLFDLSAGNIALAKAKSLEFGIGPVEFVVGNVLELDRHVESASFDVVLLMGPLYHLLDEGDRKRAVEQAPAALKPGGLLFASFISGFAPLIDVLKKCPDELTGRVGQYLDYLEGGANVVSQENPGFTDAFFETSGRAERFMAGFGLERLGFYTQESLLGAYENQLRAVGPETFDACIDVAMRLVEDERCRSGGEHLLFVGRKPDCDDKAVEVSFVEVSDPDLRERICRAILGDLPLWFGLLDSNEEYARSVRDLSFIAAMNGEEVVGFASTRRNSPFTMEIYVMGLKAEWHRRGIGTRLVEKLAKDARQEGFRFLEVKTLDESRENEQYRLTRLFYRKVGFLPLDVLPEFWGRNNPCLVMVKPL